MTDSDMELKLRQAGIDTDRARLYEAVCAALRSTRLDPDRALGRVLSALREDTKLLTALVRLYVQQCADDMRGGVSQSDVESHHATDRPIPAPLDSSGGGSHYHDESHRASDPSPAPSSPAGARQCRTESQPGIERRAEPAPTKIPKAVAVAFARGEITGSRSAFDIRLGTHLHFRDATIDDLVNGERGGNRVAYVCRRLREEFNWTSRDQKVPDLVTEAQFKEILDSSQRSLGPVNHPLL